MVPVRRRYQILGKSELILQNQIQRFLDGTKCKICFPHQLVQVHSANANAADVTLHLSRRRFKESFENTTTPHWGKNLFQHILIVICVVNILFLKIFGRPHRILQRHIAERNRFNMF